MKKDKVVVIGDEGELIHQPNTFIKQVLRFIKPYRYFSETFGQDEKLEVWTRKFWGTEYLYKRKQRSGGISLEFKFEKDRDVLSSTSSCSEHVKDFSSIPPGFFDNYAPVSPFLSAEESKVVGPIPDGLFTYKPNTVTNPNIEWIDDKWFDKTKLIDTGYTNWFVSFFLTENGTLIGNTSYGSFIGESAKPVYRLATAREVYEYECWKMFNQEGWITQINPNPNNAL